MDSQSYVAPNAGDIYYENENGTSYKNTKLCVNRFPAVPVGVREVCSRLCSAWSRSLTSSSKASCSLLLLLFSFFSRF